MGTQLRISFIPAQVEVIQANLKILDALLSLLHKLTNALNQFAQAIASKITKDNSVPSTGQLELNLLRGENTIQFITSTHNSNAISLSLNSTKSSSQPEGEHIKKNKGKKALSSEKAEKVSTNSDSDDDETHMTGSMQQKMIEEEAKAKAAKHESKVRKEELVDLFSPEVVKKYYNDKLHYAFSDSLLLTPLCCDDIHDVTPRVSALAGCDRLVSEPLVIENILVMFSPTRKKSRWGTVFPTGLKRYKEPLVEPKEIG
ncbi:hypothetical protein Tco_0870258 [Tanacetum coccineum]